MPTAKRPSAPHRAGALVRASALSAALLCLALGACEQRSEAAAAIDRARIELDSADAGERGAATLQGVINDLSPYTSEGEPAARATASVLIARARIGLAAPMVDTVIAAEGEALNKLNIARAELGQWISLSAASAAYAAFDPDDDLAQMRQDETDRQRELDEAVAQRAELTQRIDALEDQIAQKLEQARGMRVREGELTLRLAQVSATEAAELAEQARAVGREADAIEFEAAEIEAQAAEIRPDLMEAGLAVDRLEGQIATVRSAMAEVTAAVEQSGEDARSAKDAAELAAGRFDALINEIVSMRTEQIDRPTENARDLLRRAAQDASRARSTLRDQGTVVLGHANQWLATLLSARVAGLEALTGQLERAVNAEPPAPNSSRYATLLNEQRELLESERAALAEALDDAQQAMESGRLREPEPEAEGEVDSGMDSDPYTETDQPYDDADNGDAVDDAAEEPADEDGA